jgi:tetratricopeptide (TPR) repeat protein
MATIYCRQVAASVVDFLRQQMMAPSASVDFQASVDGAVQFLMSAYQLRDELIESVTKNLPGDLMEIFDAGCRKILLDRQLGQALKHRHHALFAPPASEEDKANAEMLKDEGDRLMALKDDDDSRFHTAAETYSRALEIDPNNAACYCNRAEAYYKLNDYQSAINDCDSAIQLNRQYARAFSRKAIVHSALQMHPEAYKLHYEAARLEPDSDSYKRNLQRAKAFLRPREANAIECELEIKMKEYVECT